MTGMNAITSGTFPSPAASGGSIPPGFQNGQNEIQPAPDAPRLVLTPGQVRDLGLERDPAPGQTMDLTCRAVAEPGPRKGSLILALSEIKARPLGGGSFEDLYAELFSGREN